MSVLSDIYYSLPLWPLYFGAGVAMLMFTASTQHAKTKERWFIMWVSALLLVNSASVMIMYTFLAYAEPTLIIRGIAGRIVISLWIASLLVIGGMFVTEFGAWESIKGQIDRIRQRFKHSAIIRIIRINR